MGGCRVIQPGNVIGTALGLLAEIYDFLSADVYELSALPETSDASTSTPREGTETVHNKSPAFNIMHNSLLPYLSNHQIQPAIRLDPS